VTQKSRATSVVVAASVACLGLVSSACGSGSGSPTTSAPATAAPTTASITTVPVVSPVTTGRITGFGATIDDWATVHMRSSEPVAGEPKASYWGPRTSSASVFASDRVVALSINFPTGTSLAKAEQETFNELPADHKETFNEILMNDANGNSCLLVNIESAALAAVLKGPPFNDPSGTVGIEFATVISDTAIGYRTSNIDGAFLQLRPNTTESTC
jgi:hypothetical protein